MPLMGLEGRVVGAHVEALGQVAVASFSSATALGVGLPVALARGFEHALDGLRQRVRVVRLEPLLQAQLVLVAHVDVDELLPLVVAHDLARHAVQPQKLFMPSSTCSVPA
jgi:hypothetical protein